MEGSMEITGREGFVLMGDRVVSGRTMKQNRDGSNSSALMTI
jgi:hypothetical protein